NLAGDLIVLRQALEEFRVDPVFGSRAISGLRDGVLALRVAVGPKSERLRAGCDALDRLLEPQPRSAVEWQAQIAAIGRAAGTLHEAAADAPGDEAVEVRAWCAELLRAIEELERDLETLLPWARVLAVQPPPFGDGLPLDGKPDSRPHIFAELVDIPVAPRGLAEVPEAIDRALGELAVQQAWLDAEPAIDE